MTSKHHRAAVPSQAYRRWTRLGLAMLVVLLIGPVGVHCSSPFAPDPLVRFETCEALTDFVATRLIHPQPTTSGIGATVGCDDASVNISDGGLGFTVTTTQVAGVDEPDFVKNTGEILFTLRRGSLIVSRMLPIEEAAVLATLTLPGTPRGLHFDGQDTILAVGSDGGDVVLMTIVDVSDPAEPYVRRQTRIDGSLLTSRRIDDTVFVVTKTTVTSPVVLRDGAFHDEENFARLQDAGVDGLLPRVVDIVDGERQERQAFACDAAWAPSRTTGVDVTVTHAVSLRDVTAPIPSTAVVGVAADVYVSRTSLILVGTEHYDGGPFTEPFTVSRLHRLGAVCGGRDNCSLANAPIAHTGSAVVDGRIPDAQAMDDHDGDLRLVLTAEPTAAEVALEAGLSSTVSLLILDAEDPFLTAKARLDGITGGRHLEHARFVDDDLYVTTFPAGHTAETAFDASGLPQSNFFEPIRRFDLGEGTAPRLAQSIDFPGWVAQLQPLDDGRLVALGIATRNNRYDGVLLQQVLIDDGVGTSVGAGVGAGEDAGVNADGGAAVRLTDNDGGSDALVEPHALTIFPAEGLVAVPVQSFDGGLLTDSGLLVVDVGAPGAGPLVDEQPGPGGGVGGSDDGAPRVVGVVSQKVLMGPAGLERGGAPCAAIRRAVMIKTPTQRWAAAVSTAGVSIQRLDTDPGAPEVPATILPFAAFDSASPCDSAGGSL